MHDSSPAWVYRPTIPEEISDLFRFAAERRISVGFRGAGRSYGDAPLNGENIVIDLRRMCRILEWNPETGLITVEPGVTVGDIWRHSVEDGWWPPVVPGTMFPTIGGCTAMNVHGKNCYRVGPIGDHVEQFRIITPAGEDLLCSRTENRDLFFSAIGGFGMLGAFTSITLRLKKIHSGLLSVRALNVPDFEAMQCLFLEEEERSDYLVGWVDAFARGKNCGRGVVHAARYLERGEDPFPARTLRTTNQELPENLLGVIPKSILWRFMRPIMNDPGMRLLNRTKYRMSRWFDRGAPYRQSHAAFAFLLDYVPDWRRAYGPGGLVQYQSFLPASSAIETFSGLLTASRERGQTPYLSVFKKHRADEFLISHGVDGYSLALDYKVDRSFRREMPGLAREMTAAVLEAGGRFYFAKDSLLNADEARSFLGEDVIGKFAALKRRHDPTGILESDLARRLFGHGSPTQT